MQQIGGQGSLRYQGFPWLGSGKIPRLGKRGNLREVAAGADFPEVACNPASRFTSRSPSFENKLLKFGQVTDARSASALTARGYGWARLVRFTSRAL